jgi:peroxiredoxin
MTWRHASARAEHRGPAPDFLFEHAGGRSVALRRFRGRHVVLTFWTTWAEGCLPELRRLDALARGKDPRHLLVLAIADGERACDAARHLDAAGIALKLVADPERHIASRYAVSCWPTTIALDLDGRVSAVSLGTARRRRGRRWRGKRSARPNPQSIHCTRPLDGARRA